MTRSFPSAVLSVCLLLPVVAACSSRVESDNAEKPAVAVDVDRVTPGNLTESITVVGTLAPKFQSEVKAEYSGVISEVYVTEWVRVTKGAVLARFDRREPDSYLRAATAARLQAEVGATRAQRELERTVKLRENGLATQQNLDDARTAAEAAAAQLTAVRAQEEMARTRLSKTAVIAPMDGVIASRTVNPGDFIENMGAKRPMFHIVDNRRLELTVQVPSSQIGRVKVGQPLPFTVDAVPGRTFEGRVSFINPAVDEASRTVKVVAIVDNADEALKSGLFAKGAIVTGDRRGVLRIARGAMLTWDPATAAGVVYIVNGDRVQKRSVSTGAVMGEEIEISSGLNPGDTVVTRGGFNLRDGDRVTVAKPAAANERFDRTGPDGNARAASRNLVIG